MTNFRGVARGTVAFSGHALLVGGNNIGKSTVCEALDLVLGQERLGRRPVVDEHDFHGGRYLDDQDAAVDVRIEAVLVGLSEEAERRFRQHLRRWNNKTCSFVDDAAGGLGAADGADVVWALPLLFVGRYSRKDDDFIGNTFFDHPVGEVDEEDADVDPMSLLGGGRSVFRRDQKRLCGFVFLRTLRTGSRALSLQRGSLLDTVLKLGGEGAAEMWRETLDALEGLEPAIGDIERLKQIRTEIRTRMGRFVNLVGGDEATAFFASDLTREHLREVVRLFVAAQPGTHLVPFNRLGTGSINLLVFALLTFIAELKGNKSVIFAMEEPEVALPPHTQRRVAKFVLGEMGQCIVTSHSPYVIEQFDPAQIVILDRDNAGKLNGMPIDGAQVKLKNLRTERRQFAEAVLSRAVIVVEGSTEAAMFAAASTVMEKAKPPEEYTHFDLAGVSVFTASGDGDVPRHGPIFAALGKTAFGFYDKQAAAPAADVAAELARFAKHWESPEKGIENLLAKQTPVGVLKRFLADVSTRADYPARAGAYNANAQDRAIRDVAAQVLKHRKGDAHGYAAILISHCQSADEIPPTIRAVLEEVHKALAGANHGDAGGP
jgi:putative ATP-dependent endonuclease of the OLD family